MPAFDTFPKPACFFTVDERHKATHENDYRYLPRPLGSIAYVEDGEAIYTAGDTVFRLGVGDILFIPPGGTYISHWSSGPRMWVVQFTLPLGEGRGYPVQRLSAQNGDREELYEISASPAFDFTVAERFYRLCARLWPRLTRTDCQCEARILPALRYMEEHLSEVITVEVLAMRCHLSSSRFHAVFRKAAGCSPIEYRNRLRIQEAQRMLCMGDTAIADIADVLGFESATYFRRVFHTHAGMSPREYRQRGGGWL